MCKERSKFPTLDMNHVTTICLISCLVVVHQYLDHMSHPTIHPSIHRDAADDQTADKCQPVPVTLPSSRRCKLIYLLLSDVSHDSTWILDDPRSIQTKLSRHIIFRYRRPALVSLREIRC